MKPTVERVASLSAVLRNDCPLCTLVHTLAFPPQAFLALLQAEPLMTPKIEPAARPATPPPPATSPTNCWVPSPPGEGEELEAAGGGGAGATAGGGGPGGRGAAGGSAGGGAARAACAATRAAGGDAGVGDGPLPALPTTTTSCRPASPSRTSILFWTGNWPATSNVNVCTPGSTFSAAPSRWSASGCPSTLTRTSMMSAPFGSFTSKTMLGCAFSSSSSRLTQSSRTIGGQRRVRADAELCSCDGQLAGAAEILRLAVRLDATVLGHVGQGRRRRERQAGHDPRRQPPLPSSCCHRHSFLNIRLPLVSK
jgi:hypothetical protein